MDAYESILAVKNTNMTECQERRTSGMTYKLKERETSFSSKIKSHDKIGNNKREQDAFKI